MALHASSIQTLREFVRDHRFDFGCHPRAREHERRGFVMGALLTEDEIGVARDNDLDVEVLYSDVPSEIAADTTVSKVDRFEDGAIAPQGLGSQNSGEGGTHVPGGIMNPTEIGTAIKGLVNTRRRPSSPRAVAQELDHLLEGRAVLPVDRTDADHAAGDRADVVLVLVIGQPADR